MYYVKRYFILVRKKAYPKARLGFLNLFGLDSLCMYLESSGAGFSKAVVIPATLLTHFLLFVH